jgi:hypothetical protein
LLFTVSFSEIGISGGRIEELLRIKGSVQTELQNLEKKRQVMLQDLTKLTSKIGTFPDPLAYQFRYTAYCGGDSR